ncbi:MAG: glucosamine-6-phosphate deaminase [Malacoplasma sp.]|nr:glucosamine-6-phosphate deaminase [Malacoplasma sp.]MDE7075286.1 glucosamine-6-phosphate deaminase [Malacoplasma sp.]
MSNIKFVSCDSYEELSKLVGQEFINTVLNKPNAILGLATGSSPIGTYNFLASEFAKKKVSFKDCLSFNLDEYVGLTKKYENQSYSYFMNENLFSKIDINKNNTFFPVDAFNNTTMGNFEKYDEKIDNVGGMDILLLGIGNNGHIGFNEPGSTIDSKTRLVDLTDSTIEANSRFFEKKTDVPTQAVSMGLATILKAKKIILIVVGKSKKEAFEKLKNSQKFDFNWPCTALINHSNTTVYYIKNDFN